MRARRHGGLVALVTLVVTVPALAAGPPVVVNGEPGTDASLLRRVREVVSQRRAVREDLPPPLAEALSPEQAALAERTASIRLALKRAQRAESEAAWAQCVREAASALSDAIEVLGQAGDLGLLRDLHVQIGACLTLDQNAPSARPHFVAAALLDEGPSKAGAHREEAERAQESARVEVTARSRGKVRIETAPAGAEVWIDGRKAPGVTPLEVDVRLGDHFVTARRFRFEPHTELAVLQPSGSHRIVLDPARRGTLREQLAALGAGAGPPPGVGPGAISAVPPLSELRLGRAVWSRAEQAVVVSRAGDAYRVEVLDAITGQTLRASRVASTDSDDVLRREVCDALGETCAPKAGGIPWYVWPIAGAALAGAVVSTTFIVNASRQYRFCAAGGAGC